MIKICFFKPAEVGGLVVQDTIKYQKEILSHLANEKFYKKLKGDPILSFQSDIFTYLDNAKTFLNLNLISFTVNIQLDQFFFTLPKIHE